MKRPADDVALEAEHPCKRIATAAAAATELEQPNSSASTLLSLPNELLLKVFHAAREPCMIHACRRLHDILPSYINYTKSLVGLAFGTRDPGNPICIYHDQTWPLDGCSTREWTAHQRNELQRDVSRSSWFTMKHFKKTNVTCLKELLDGLPWMTPTKAQTQILKALKVLPEVDQSVSRDMHIMAVSQLDDGHETPTLTRLSIRDNMIQLHYLEDGGRKMYDMFSISYIPDCLFRGPVSLSQFNDLKQWVRYLTLDVEFDGATAHQYSLYDLQHSYGLLACSDDLLSTRIESLLAANASHDAQFSEEEIADYLRLLLAVNWVCQGSFETTFDILKNAAGPGHLACFKILCSSFMILDGQSRDVADYEEEEIELRSSFTVEELNTLLKSWHGDPERVEYIAAVEERLLFEEHPLW
jgi:hypothetical protein